MTTDKTQNVSENTKSEEMSPEDVLRVLLSADHVVEDKFHMKRFKLDFTLTAIDGNLIDRLQDRCTHYVGKGRNRVKEVDEQKFGALVIQHGCKVPDWTDASVLKAYNTQDPTDAIKKRLLAGEIQKLSGAILELSGYTEDDTEDVKN